MPHRVSILLLIAIVLLTTAARPFETGSLEFKDVGAFPEFGVKITFQATLQTTDDIQQVFLFLEPEDSSSRLVEVPLQKDGTILFEYSLQDQYIRPFSRVTYWFRAYGSGGKEIDSERFSFQYIDNRFKWQSLKNDDFEVYWINGDLHFGQALLDIASRGQENAVKIIAAKLPSPLQIFVYPSAADLQSAFATDQADWVAGHASPEMGLILVSIAPGADQGLEMERQIPHELMHILQYQAAGSGYTNFPVWFSEGSASIAELYPNSEYRRVLQSAVESNSLMSMESLCSSFPRDASNAYLAYAQAESFTRFLYTRYGASGMQKLVETYQDGIGCEEGVTRALGISLSSLEVQWHQETLKMDIAAMVFRNLQPYLFLLAALLILPLLMVLLARRS